MKLKDINEIKEDGLVVFMPSGIQATLFNEGKTILVKYYNLKEDKYTVKDFKKIIAEGIEVFSDQPTIAQQSVLMESEGEYKLEIITGRDRDSYGETTKTSFKANNDVDAFVYVLKEYGTCASGYFNGDYEDDELSEEELENKQKVLAAAESGEDQDEAIAILADWYNDMMDPSDYYDDILTITAPDGHIVFEDDTFDVNYDELDYFDDEEDDMDESILDKLSKKGFIRKSLKEAYENVKNPEGTVFKALKDKKKEYITPEFKLEMLNCLDRIAREYPDIKIRQQALTFMDEINIQEYWDIKAVKDFIKKPLEVLNTKVNESVNEEEEYEEPKQYGVEYRNMHDGIHRLIYTDSKEKAEQILAYLKELENPDTTVYDDNEIMDNSIFTWDEINKLALDCFEIDYREVGEDGMLDNIYIINHSEPKPDIYESLNENVNMMAEDIRNGKKSGEDPEFGTWLLETSLDEKWEQLTEGMKLYLMDGIADYVQQGSLKEQDLLLEIDPESGLTKEDIQSLEMFDQEEIDYTFNSEDLQLNAYVSYEIKSDKMNGDEQQESFKLKKKKKKEKIEDSINEEMEEPDLGLYIQTTGDLYNKYISGKEKDQVEWDNLINDGIEGYKKEVENKNFTDEEKEAAKEYVKNYFFESVEPKRYIVQDVDLNSVDPIPDSQDEFDELQDAMDCLKSRAKEAPDKYIEIVDTKDDTIIASTDEIEDGTLDEAIYLKDKEGNEVGPFESQEAEEQYIKDQKENGNKEEYEEIIKDESMSVKNEDCYKVYSTIDPDAQPISFNSWNEVEDHLNSAWGEYKASMAKENAEFGTDEDRDNFMGNFEVAIEPIEIPVEEIPAEGIELPAEPVIEPIEEPCEDGECEEVKPEICPECGEEECVCEPCPECGKTPCECEGQVTGMEPPVDEIEEDFEDEHIGKSEEPAEEEQEETEEEIKTPEEAADKVDEIDDALDSLEDFLNTLIGDEELTDEEKAEIEALETEEEKNEDFQDNMGMLTDINDLDFPDALADAVDTKEDGSLYRISDLAKELEGVKSSIEQMKNDFKSELTTMLQDLKNDLKLSVNNVETKVQDTKSAVDNLTSEEEDLEDVEFEQEEAPVEEEGQEEAPVEEETEENMEESFDEASLKGNPIYENIKTILAFNTKCNGKMSVPTIAEKLREEYGLNTKIGAIYNNVSDICNKTSIKESIIDVYEEKQLLKESMLGKAAKWLGGGLMSRLEQQKQQAKYENIEAVKQQIDKEIQNGADAEQLKDTITLASEDENEEKQAKDYAIQKLQQKAPTTESLLNKLKATSKTAQLKDLNIRG